MIKNLIRKIIGRRLCAIIGWNLQVVRCLNFFWYDYCRYIRYSGCFARGNCEPSRAAIMMAYHVVEKGLTMPFRRKKFGKDAVLHLMRLIDEYECKFGKGDAQVEHAIGVLKEYRKLHNQKDISGDIGADEFWKRIDDFCARYYDVESSVQKHYTYDSFYANNDLSFPNFAQSRHTVRHYTDEELTLDKLKEAVDIALTSPSACNRQHCRVHCISDKLVIRELLTLQRGSRGFGEYANKLLVVTSDLEDVLALGERNDIFINGGIFLMNLCYALHYVRIAHCILNWSRTPAEDKEARKLLKIKPSESIIAVLTCGIPPEKFEVASSPRKVIEQVFSAD